MRFYVNTITFFIKKAASQLPFLKLYLFQAALPAAADRVNSIVAPVEDGLI